MAVTETKIIQVENDSRTINASDEEWGKFGWSVLSVQVTHSQNSKDLGDKVETTTINYVTITYQRDKSMPNYRRIAELEEEYKRSAQTISNLRGKPEREGRLLNTGNIIVIVILALVFWPIAIAYYFILKWHKNKKYESTEEFRQEVARKKGQISELEQRRQAIVEEAARLMEAV